MAINQDEWRILWCERVLDELKRLDDVIIEINRKIDTVILTVGGGLITILIGIIYFLAEKK